MQDPLDREIRLLRDVAGSARDPLRRSMVAVADLLRRKRDPDLALEVLADVRPELLEFGPLHLVEGRILRDLGSVGPARVSYGRALALDPDNAEALEALAEMAEAEGDRDEGSRHRRALEELVPWLGTPPRAEVADVAAKKPTDSALEWDGEPVHPSAFAPDALSDTRSSPSLPLAFDDSAAESPDIAEVGGAVESVAAAELPPPSDSADDYDWSSGAGLATEEGTVDEEGEEEAFAVYTETLAELYARQGSSARAAEVYERLLDADPANLRFRERLNELQGAEAEDLPGTVGPPAFEQDHEALAEEMSQGGGAEASVPETPFVWQGDAKSANGPTLPQEPIETYLTELLSWAPPSKADSIDSSVGDSVVPIETLAPDVELIG